MKLNLPFGSRAALSGPEPGPGEVRTDLEAERMLDGGRRWGEGQPRRRLICFFEFGPGSGRGVGTSGSERAKGILAVVNMLLLLLAMAVGVVEEVVVVMLSDEVAGMLSCW